MPRPDQQSTRRFAETYTAAWCSQNAATVAALYDENGSLSVNEDPSAVGREAITHVTRSFMTAFPDMQVGMDDLHLDDDSAIYHWTLTGTNTGPGERDARCESAGSFGNWAPTGSPIRAATWSD